MSRIEYRCPDCDRKSFETEGPLPIEVWWKCSRSSCGFLGMPVPAQSPPLHRTYRCSGCGRTQHLERPVAERTHCIVCGTPTLVIVAETRADQPLLQSAGVKR